MYKVTGLGCVGLQRTPVAIDYIVIASSREDAVKKVEELGIVIIRCLVKNS
jgi:hypothetical protein